MASRRKQEEKNLKQIRELAALPYNKKCFDCDQKGPTYVNTTIGSFVCTSCSGILRGINPPHRVKSISMTTFTQQEIEFLQKHGNEYCRKVWLGLYDSRSQGMPESRDEQRVKDFMINKYEKRRWYVSPSEIPPPTPPSSTSSASTPETKPLKTLLGDNTPNLVVHNSAQGSPAISRPQSSQSTSALAPAAKGSPAQQKKSATMDLLGDLGGDPFASAAPPPVPQQSLIPGMGTAAPPPAVGGGAGGMNGGFANFDQAFSSGSAPGFAAQPNAGGLPPGMSSAGSMGSGDFGAFTSSTPAAASSGPAQGSTGSDKYAALADLFSTDSTNQTSLVSGSPNFGATFSGQPEGLQAASRPSSNPYNLDWGSGGGSAGQQALGGSSSTGMSWGQTSSTTSSMARTVAAPGPANPFLSSTAPAAAPGTNPFFGGGGGGQPNGAFGTQPQTSMGGGFGQQAQSAVGGNFGSFGGVPTSSAGFGVPLSQTGFGGSQAGFAGATSGAAPPSYNAAVYGGVGLQQGAQPVSNGGWGNFSQGGGVPAQMAYGGQQQQMNPYGAGGFGGAGMPGGPQGGAMPQGGAYTQQQQQQQQQQFTGWGQKQAAGNPFMGAAPQANPSNPFL